MKVVHLDEIAPGRPEGVDWLPLRAELGLRAFGASAYRANAGEPVVPRHSEASGGGAGVHDELYVVMSGRATFTVEGESFDAPAGEAYRVAPWEYGNRAARAAELRDVDELERVTDEGVAAYGEHVTMLYGRACVAAQRGRREEALQYLDRAAHDEDFGDWVRENAPNEPLLEPIRDDPAFLR